MSIHPHIPRFAPSPEATGSPANPLVEHVCYDPPAIDPHGFDPTEYDWVPVKRKKRADGWSNEKQRKFVETLADEGSVKLAAQAVGMSVQSCYRLRRQPGADNFARAWDAAVAEAGKRLLDVAFERATVGAEEPVFDRDGQVLAIRKRPSDRMLIFLLRMRMGDAAGRGDWRVDAGDIARGARPAAKPDALPTVAQALIALEPTPLAAPHLSMSPDALAHAIQIADLGDGELPHWRRDPPVEPVALPGLANRPTASPLGAEFDRLLEEAKQGAFVESSMPRRRGAR